MNGDDIHAFLFFCLCMCVSLSICISLLSVSLFLCLIERYTWYIINQYTRIYSYIDVAVIIQRSQLILLQIQSFGVYQRTLWEKNVPYHLKIVTSRKFLNVWDQLWSLSLSCRQTTAVPCETTCPCLSLSLFMCICVYVRVVNRMASPSGEY